MMALYMGYTPIFEYVGPDNRIVVRYDKPAVILTALRRTKSGEYMTYDSMKQLAEEAGIPVVRAWGVSTSDLQSFLHYARNLEDIEGFVVRWEDGTMCKIKADAYVRQHRSKDALTSEKNVLALVLNGEEDDLLPILVADDAKALQDYAQDVREAMKRWSYGFVDYVTFAKNKYGDDRKAFALEVVPKLPDCFRGPAFKVYEGKDPMEELRKHSLNMTTNNAKAETLAKTLNVRWKDYAS
jgi:RNA ligase